MNDRVRDSRTADNTPESYAENYHLRWFSHTIRLTDEERHAVETAALEADAHQHAERAATLRGLLERLA